MSNNNFPSWTEIHREEADYARRTRKLSRSMTTPEERREAKRTNRRHKRDKWRRWQERAA